VVRYVEDRGFGLLFMPSIAHNPLKSRFMCYSYNVADVDGIIKQYV